MSFRGGVSRPWDRPGGWRNHNKRAKRSVVPHDEGGVLAPGTAAASSGRWDGRGGGTAPGVPSVAVDGIEYYSDRFYLASTEYDDVHQQLGEDAVQPSTIFEEEPCRRCGFGDIKVPTKPASKSSSSDCRSDVLDVSKLVASLDLKAALLATFSLDTEWFLEQFPSLAGRVPTLVLHGQRGSMNANASGADNEGNKKGVGQPRNGSLAGVNDTDEDDDACSVDSMDSEELYTQPEETLAYVRAVMDGAAGTTDGCISENSQEAVAVSPALNFTKVITKWVPPATGTGKQAGEFKAGVHHPKFLLLFETSGSLVVVVTTANLTPRRTIDGVWVQRFLASLSRESQTASIAADATTADFGRVLQSLLTAQTHAIQIHASKNRDMVVPMTPHAFCRRHLGWDNLDPISTAFDYSTAQVHLVATVPGAYRSPEYGRQRVSHILSRLSFRERRPGGTSDGRPWLPPDMLTNNDRVVIQPTSFGEWTDVKLSEVLRSYLGESEARSHTGLERLDIVWPSEKFIQSVRSHLKSLKSTMATSLPLQDSTMKQLHRRYGQSQRPSIETKPDSKYHKSVSAALHVVGRSHSHQAASNPSGKLRPFGMPHERRTRGGYMFLSSTTFNKIETSCLSRMVQWEPCHPVPMAKRPVLVSHLKTISRVVGQAPSRSKGRVPWYRARGCEVDEVFSWVLMTSACLSRGAQGESLDGDAISRTDETVSYANFELGVLFVSRLQHKPTDRVYCWKKSGCSCQANADDTSNANRFRDSGLMSGPRMIPLPFPHRFDAARYQCDEDGLEFAETPYFHEITPSDCHVGNMRMTPFGEYVAQKLDDE